MDNITFTAIQDNIKNLSYVALKRLKHLLDDLACSACSCPFHKVSMTALSVR